MGKKELQTKGEGRESTLAKQNRVLTMGPSLLFNSQSAVTDILRRSKSHPVMTESSIHCPRHALFHVRNGLDEMKSNKLKRQKLERQNQWQQLEHAKL